MSINDFKKTKLWHKEFKALGYDSKLIFKKAKTKFEILSSLSFFFNNNGFGNSVKSTNPKKDKYYS